MARTKNFKRTGAAAVIERRERTEAWMKDASTLRKSLFVMLLHELKEVDPEGWEAWYDNDDNIPFAIDFSNPAESEEIIGRMKSRIEEVQKNGG